MNEFYTLLTNYGIAKIVEARANKQTINLSHIAVGDGEIVPNESMIALKNEKHRLAINSIIQDSNNPSYLIIEGIIPVNIGGFYINEVGVFDESGNLFAIGNIPKTYKPLLSEGSAKDLTLKITIEVTNAKDITLKIDDSVVLATRQWVLANNYTKKQSDERFLLKNEKATDSLKLDGKDASEFVLKSELSDGSPIVTEKAVKEYINKNASIGINQAWQDVAPERELNVTYTNTTGRPIAIMLNTNLSIGDNKKGFWLNNMLVSNLWDSSNAKNNFFTIILPNQTYKVDAELYIDNWLELR